MKRSMMLVFAILFGSVGMARADIVTLDVPSSYATSAYGVDGNNIVGLTLLCGFPS